MRISGIAIVIILLILLLFAAFTIYGNKVGNFVINVGEDGDIRLSLSDHDDLSEQTERLVYSSLMALDSATYDWFPADLARQGLGNLSDEKNSYYLAYSFYLINNSTTDLDCTLDLNIVDTVGDPLGMLRVMLIEGENDTFDPSNRIYALPESTPERDTQLKTNLRAMRYYEAEPFLIAENKVFSVYLRDFAEGEYRKFTVLLWLEGNDLDCNDNQAGSRIKLQLDIVGH